ncbi:unnamed protein product [Adineta steineri]|uniref:Uncharacterized protein n=1 Tax=Adineta steineri TaxID=433720 RepID=A0A814VVS7_9BILA|nr:unnamed protein product [Adineta steineri]
MDLNNCDPIMIQTALDSLVETHIETLAVKIVGILEERYRSYGLNLAQFFQLPTVKKLTFATNVAFPYDFFDNVIKPSNIEYFTFADPEINVGDLSLLLRLMPNLKYLNIRLTSAQYGVRRWRDADQNKPFPLMPMIKTYIVHVNDEKSIDFDRLAHHLKAMPALLQLEVTAPHTVFNAQNWEDLITSSLKKLIHLRLYATRHYQDPETVVQITDAFKTPFWVKKTNFVFMLMQLIQHKKAREQSETIERLGRASFNIDAYHNLRTVRLPPKALAALTNDKSQVFSTVQYLDLRHEKELFHSECIEQIRELFPNVEHLVFNTESLDCVPNLACCLPRLRSLTCMMHDQDPDWEPGSIRYHLNKWSQSLRRKCDLFFCREEDFLIIWLDKASIENTRWHTFRTKQTSEEERQHFAALFDAPNSEVTSDADENNYYGRQDRKRRRYQPHPNDLFFDEYDYDT